MIKKEENFRGFLRQWTEKVSLQSLQVHNSFRACLLCNQGEQMLKKSDEENSMKVR
jgi:hypothetical protein